MRTTIELKSESRARLLEIAARRGEKGFSRLINQAVDLYLETAAADGERRRAALSLRGRLGKEEAGELRAATTALRESWR
jgi:hypothetical protein